MAPRQFLVGVATTVQAKEKTLKGRKVKRPALHYCRMAESTAGLGARMIIFNPDDVNWATGTVSGWKPVSTARPYGDWEQTTERLPDVIYENVFVHLAVQGKCRKMRAEAKERGIPLFNPPLPSKWQSVSFMKSAGLGRYVPDTLLLKDVDRAVRAIDEWKVTYVKPVGGYGGSGVMRVEALGGQKYRISVDRSNQGVQKLRRVVGRSDLQRILRSRTRVNHLVQKGIPLLNIDGRSVDFRVVTERGVDGEWLVVGIVPKLAAADGVVTNIVAGGERLSMEQLQTLASRHGVTIPTKELAACALACSKKLSDRVPRAGLLGFDLGADRNGRVWVIEINPKPARSLLDDSQKQQMAKHAAGFAVYLARVRFGRIANTNVKVTAASTHSET